MTIESGTMVPVLSWLKRIRDSARDVEFTSDITVSRVQVMGGDHMVVAAAKVSTSANEACGFANKESEASNFGLINYLMKHRHGTPFEHGAMTVFVHAPVSVWWEWVRHRIGHSFNLESGRYSVLKPVFWIPMCTRPMIPGPGHKSARPQFVEADRKLHGRVVRIMKRTAKVQWLAYKLLLSLGIANEVARHVLGFSVYYSGWVTVNPRSLMAFISLRTHNPEASYVSYPAAEIQEAAIQAEKLLELGWPLVHRAFVKNGRVSP
jgi:thymidylate synthase (FAD)